MRRESSGVTLTELLVVILIITGCGLALGPFVRKARERAYTAACANNLRKISLALHKYAKDHDGAFPAVSNLTEFVGSLADPNTLYAEDLSIFICPNTGHKKAFPGDMANSPVDYMYSSGLRVDSPPNLPIAADKVKGPGLTKGDNHGLNGINVLYVNGDVKRLTVVPGGEWIKE